MKVVPLNDFLQYKDFYIMEAKAGKFFIYPTDTVYGIWALYTPENVDKIIEIKQSSDRWQPSIIVPNFEWIQKRFPEADIKKMKKQLEDYHWVTYIFDYNKPWMRIIKHAIQDFVISLNEWFISTSCNLSRQPTIVDIKDIPEEIANKVDYIIDGGIGWGKPSVLIDLVSNKVIER